MKAAALILAAVTLAGCAAPGGVLVYWKRTPAAQVDAACRAAIRTGPEVQSYRACSWFDERGALHIIAPDVRSVDDCAAMRRLGHELVHGFDGNWHGPYETMKPGPCT